MGSKRLEGHGLWRVPSVIQGKEIRAGRHLRSEVTHGRDLLLYTVPTKAPLILLHFCLCCFASFWWVRQTQLTRHDAPALMFFEHTPCTEFWFLGSHLCVCPDGHVGKKGVCFNHKNCWFSENKAFLQ